MTICLTLREARGNTILWAHRGLSVPVYAMAGSVVPLIIYLCFCPRSTYNYNCINRIKLESRSRWRAIAIAEWAPAYSSVRCYMYMYMIAQPENATFFRCLVQKG
jgi:hypothetical protein